MLVLTAKVAVAWVCEYYAIRWVMHAEDECSKYSLEAVDCASCQCDIAIMGQWTC